MLSVALIASALRPFTTGGGDELYVMNADGSGRTRLTRNTAWDGDATWSPDGRCIAFVRHLPNDPRPCENSEIFVMRPDGSGETRLTRNRLRDESSVWSPDGSRIVFESDPRRAAVREPADSITATYRTSGPTRPV